MLENRRYPPSRRHHPSAHFVLATSPRFKVKNHQYHPRCRARHSRGPDGGVHGSIRLQLRQKQLHSYQATWRRDVHSLRSCRRPCIGRLPHQPLSNELEARCKWLPSCARPFTQHIHAPLAGPGRCLGYILSTPAPRAYINSEHCVRVPHQHLHIPGLCFLVSDSEQPRSSGGTESCAAERNIPS